METILYSTTTCPFCKQLKGYLAQKGVEFIEKFIDVDEVALEEMKRYSEGFLGVPFLVVKRGEKVIQRVVGFDRNKLNQIFTSS